jgi:hypothetical protein
LTTFDVYYLSITATTTTHKQEILSMLPLQRIRRRSSSISQSRSSGSSTRSPPKKSCIKRRESHRSKKDASATTSKQHRVQFASTNFDTNQQGTKDSILIIPSRHNLTRKQRTKLWYTEDDLRAIAYEIRDIISQMVGMTTDDEEEGIEEDAFIDVDPQLPTTSGASITSTSSSNRSSSSSKRSTVTAEDCCVVDFAPSSRGLESLTPVGARQKKILILDGMCAVFLEQERQRQQNTYNPHLIRNAYVAYSSEAAQAAAALGLRDQRVAFEVQQEEDDNSDLELSRFLYEEGVDDDTHHSSETKKVLSSVGGGSGSGDPDVDEYHPVAYFDRFSIASTAETDNSTDLQPHFTDEEKVISNDGAGGRAAHNNHHGGRKQRSIVKRLLTGSHFR